MPDSILAVIDDAEQYPEGRAVRIEIRNKSDRELPKKLAAVKMANGRTAAPSGERTVRGYHG